ncbi:thioredoxin [Corallococcus sp. NCSPR001]|uniref:thioredoxin n=2 Tax=unclassified Corallococcus TaxID=2685029 RepID=UPI001A8EF9EF|nr:thioredoxin [Corallococcus sp. NCSPR001]MBN9683648.1 thioredoxin [Corallococcus sp. NCSPR001]
MPINATTDATFQQDVLDCAPPVMVYFWAPWCGPCRMMAPVLEEIGMEYTDRARVLKLDTDENPIVASRFGIRSIPTTLVFKGGQLVDSVIGAVPKASLTQALEKYL